MLTGVVLVCSLAITPDLGLCTRQNAVDVMKVPSAFSNAVSCLLQGQIQLAQTTIGRELTADQRIKVICSPSP
jgi:hypothetical protein